MLMVELIVDSTIVVELITIVDDVNDVLNIAYFHDEMHGYAWLN